MICEHPAARYTLGANTFCTICKCGVLQNGTTWLITLRPEPSLAERQEAEIIRAMVLKGWGSVGGIDMDRVTYRHWLIGQALPGVLERQAPQSNGVVAISIVAQRSIEVADEVIKQLDAEART